MDHGGGHGGHDMPGDSAPKCSMNMLWNHQVADTCVVFRSWHISGNMGMFISCLIIIGISVGYAAILARTRRYERTLLAKLSGQASPGYSTVPDETGSTRLPTSVRVVRAGMYATSVAISYFLMLVAMTYNTYLCTAIVVGAFVGHYLYEGEVDLNLALANSGARGLACH